MNNELRIKNKGLKEGFTLIFAVLIVSLLIAIAISISNIALKQLAISAVSRESQIAFYAADSGAECAIYWDVQGPYLTPAFNFASPDTGSIGGTMSCGASLDAQPSFQVLSDSTGTYYQNNFTVRYGAQSPCAVVILKKYADSNVIDSYGINDCSDTDNKYRVERAIRVNYK